MDHVTLHRSAAAATRLAAAHEFLHALSPATEAIVVGTTREAADDLARDQSVPAWRHLRAPPLQPAAAGSPSHRDSVGRARSGAVDLAFKQEGIWVIVDFKTDRQLGRTLDVYQRQVQLYAQMVAHATGEPTRSVLMRI